VETLELTSSDIVDRCVDLVENKYTTLTGEFDEPTPWDSD